MDVVPVPVSASVLVGRELDRRRRLSRRGNVLTGCRDVDEYVLLGGLERGSVVGVSAEEDEMGLLIGLQAIARLLVAAVLKNDSGDCAGTHPRAMIITVLPVNILLPKLRHVLVNQVSVIQSGLQNVNKHVKQCLENISISMVFDIEGLQEVLGEINAIDSETADIQRQTSVRDGSERPLEAINEPYVPTDVQPPRPKTEILDSQDEDDSTADPGIYSVIPEPIEERSTSVPIPQESKKRPPRAHTPQSNTPPTGTNPPPDLILITHMSSLLNALFMGRDKPSAHETMATLSSQLCHLAHNGGPLVIILNSTTTPSFSSAAIISSPSTTTTTTTTEQRPGHHEQHPRKSTTATETTLRSIFAQQQQPGMPPSRTKPSFGLVFTRLLDLHLLCTRVLRGKGPGGGATSATSASNTSVSARDVNRTGIGSAAGISAHRFAWVLEVLLDEMGVYDYECGEGGGDGELLALGEEGGGGGGGYDRGVERPVRRRCREGRWGAVEVEEGEAGVVGV